MQYGSGPGVAHAHDSPDTKRCLSQTLSLTHLHATVTVQLSLPPELPVVPGAVQVTHLNCTKR